MDLYPALLSFVVFLPALGALCLAFLPGQNKDLIRWFTLIVTLVVLAVVAWMAWPGNIDGQFNVAVAEVQDAFSISWIPSFDIYYFMGTDGISFPLVMLTALISVLACGASWSIEKHVKAYFILFLLLETGMIGVFLALDFFLFYVFWEVMLLPMYFLIGVWGGPRKEYAAIKFFLFTLVGSVLMLIAILMLYFASDLTKLSPQQLAAAHVLDHYYDRVDAGEELPAEGEANGDSPDETPEQESADDGTTPANPRNESPAPPAPPDEAETGGGAPDEGEGAGLDDNAQLHFVAYLEEEPHSASSTGASASTNDDTRDQAAANLLMADIDAGERSRHTFNILALQKMGQMQNGPFTTSDWTWNVPWLGAVTLQHWAFWLLFIGFIIKVPSVPFHTWLPDAHVEAPTPISMILAGVLLKMGGYGIIRMCYPICPLAGYDCAFWICLIGVVSMVYGAFAAMAQKDFKRLVAYSSVSHMGYVVLGLGVWSMGMWWTGGAKGAFNPEYWNMGVKGAMFQMIAHGISSAGMFFMVGVIYDRVHHRNLNEFGGLFGKMPGYTAMAIGLFFAGLGLPGLCGFIGEVLVVLSVWKFSVVLAVISAAVVILTAGYILWAVQRVYLGAEYRGPHEEALTPMKPREWAVAIPLFVLAILLGIFPYRIMGMPSVLQYMDATIDAQTEDLRNWTLAEVQERERSGVGQIETNDTQTMLADSP